MCLCTHLDVNKIPGLPGQSKDLKCTQHNDRTECHTHHMTFDPERQIYWEVLRFTCESKYRQTTIIVFRSDCDEEISIDTAL